MNTKIAALMPFLVLLIIAPFVGGVFAQASALPGVAVGNTFTYANTFFWNSTMPTDVAPFSLLAQNQSTLQITVEQVSGSTVLLQKVWTYKNGTQNTSSEPDEVNGGITGTVLVYAANLTAGGYLFPGSTNPAFVINDTTFRTYTGNSIRDTNHIIVNNTAIDGEIYSFMNLYFDRQTGMLVEYYLTTVYTQLPNQSVTQHLVLTDSNVWTVSSNTSPSNSSSPAASSSSPASSQTPAPSGSSPSNNTENLPLGLIITIAVVVVVVIVAGFLLLRKPKPKQEPAASPPSDESSYSI
jgi:hypothetical protein